MSDETGSLHMLRFERTESVNDVIVLFLHLCGKIKANNYDSITTASAPAMNGTSDYHPYHHPVSLHLHTFFSQNSLH